MNDIIIRHARQLRAFINDLVEVGGEEQRGPYSAEAKWDNVRKRMANLVMRLEEKVEAQKAERQTMPHVKIEWCPDGLLQATLVISEYNTVHFNPKDDYVIQVNGAVIRLTNPPRRITVDGATMPLNTPWSLTTS